MKLRFDKYLSILKLVFSIVFTSITTFLSFIPLDKIGITNICTKILILIILLVFCFFVSQVVCYCKSTEKIWSRGSGSISIKYGDLLKKAFSKRTIFSKNKGGIYVIPVNTHFDTIIEDETIPNPLVSNRTIHGKWLKKYMGFTNKSSDDIQKEIYDYLDKKEEKYSVVSRNKGSKRLYPLGTCVILYGPNNTSFVLFALSHFDDKNNAYVSKDSLIESTHKLLLFINQNCQGKKCYIPLMGTSLSRVGLSHKESLHILLSTMSLYNYVIFNPIEIVIFNKDKDKVSIFDK